MWWGVGVGAAVLYFIALVAFGTATLRNGHGWMFVFGIFFPLFWVIGAFTRPTAGAAGRG
jgi:hypothetical protein